MLRLKMLAFLMIISMTLTSHSNRESLQNLNIISDEYVILMNQHVVNGDVDAQDWKRYLFETAIVKLVSRVSQAGVDVVTETILYIKDYGLTEAREVKETRTISMLNKTEIKEYRTIMTKEYVVTIRDGKATKMPNPAGDLLEAMTNQKEQQFGKGIMDAMNGKEEAIPSKTIANKECECIKNTVDLAGIKMSSIQCSYKKFPFEVTSSGMGGDNSEKVISFKENVAIPKEPFEY